MTKSSVSRSSRSRRLRLALVLVAALLIPAGAGIVYAYSPLEYDFYPKCVFRLATGLNCPGCGGTRCLFWLLHGDVSQAFFFNPLLIVALPFLGWAFCRSAYTACTGKKAPSIPLPPWTDKIVAGVFIVYWVVRNFEAYPFYR